MTSTVSSLTPAGRTVGATLRAHRLGPTVVAVGTFDGVHAGHRAVLAAAGRLARRRAARVVALTFTPRPDVAVAPRTALPDLCGLDERARRLRAAGAQGVVVVEFTAEVRAMSAARFVDHLVDDVGTVAVCVGEDFALGRGREGTIPALRALGLEVVAVPLVRHEGDKIASRAMRSAVAASRGAAGRLVA